MNNDFQSRVRQFAKNCHEWWSHEWKSLANTSRVTNKLLYVITNVLPFSYMLFHVLNTQFCYKQPSKAHFPIVAKDGLLRFSIVTSPQLICDVTQMHCIQTKDIQIKFNETQFCVCPKSEVTIWDLGQRQSADNLMLVKQLAGRT